MSASVELTLGWAPAAALLTFARPEADGDARVVVLTGAGRAFVGGGDVAHMAALTPDEGERFVYRGQALLRRLAPRCPEG